jgi:environmental stress-induced protein Ves
LTLTHLPVADRTPTPWKNGGGLTWQIASDPSSAGYDFGWRISLAQVTADGPFSSFPGVDRILTVLEGAMQLSVAGRAPVQLGPDTAPYAFAGDAACRADVITPVLDLNLMVRRDRFRGEVETLHVKPESSLALDGDLIVLFVASGEVALSADACRVDGMSPLHAVRLDAPLPSSIELRSELGSRVQVLRLWRR